MVHRDQETAGIVKLALDERRRIEAGELSLSEATYQPHGARLEGGRIIHNSDPIWKVSAILGLLTCFLVVAIALSQAAIWASAWLATVSPLILAIGVGLATPAIAEFCYRWREVTRRVPYAVAEIALGTVVAGRIFLESKELSIATWLAFAAAILISVDGRARLARAIEGNMR